VISRGATLLPEKVCFFGLVTTRTSTVSAASSVICILT